MGCNVNSLILSWAFKIRFIFVSFTIVVISSAWFCCKSFNQCIMSIVASTLLIKCEGLIAWLHFQQFVAFSISPRIRYYTAPYDRRKDAHSVFYYLRSGFRLTHSGVRKALQYLMMYKLNSVKHMYARQLWERLRLFWLTSMIFNRL
jgi:hypothetical protein